MPLFRRRRREDPRGAELIERLSARHQELAGAPDPGMAEKLAALFDELGLEVEQTSAESWLVKQGEESMAVVWGPEYGVLNVDFAYAEPPELSLILLAHNADGLLSWYLVEDDGQDVVQTRVLASLPHFDRQLVIAALEAAALQLDGDKLAQRLRAQLDSPPDAAAALEAALAELGLESEPLADRVGGRVVQTELGQLELRVLPGEEAIALSVELERSRQPEDPRTALWMLKLSAAMARVGVSGPDEQGQWIVTSGFVVPNRPVSAQALAWAMINLLNLARQFASNN